MLERRGFVTGLLTVLSSVIGVVVGILLVGYTVLPALKEATGGLRETSLYTLLVGVTSAALAVATGGMEEDLAEQASAPEAVIELHESLGTVTLVVFVALLRLRHAMQWGRLKEIRSLTLGFGAIGIVILALIGYWGGELVYTTGLV